MGEVALAGPWCSNLSVDATGRLEIRCNDSVCVCVWEKDSLISLPREKETEAQWPRVKDWLSEREALSIPQSYNQVKTDELEPLSVAPGLKGSLRGLCVFCLNFFWGLVQAWALYHTTSDLFRALFCSPVVYHCLHISLFLRCVILTISNLNTPHHTHTHSHTVFKSQSTGWNVLFALVKTTGFQMVSGISSDGTWVD